MQSKERYKKDFYSIFYCWELNSSSFPFCPTSGRVDKKAQVISPLFSAESSNNSNFSPNMYRMLIPAPSRQ